MSSQAVYRVDNDVLSYNIERAEKQLLYMAPGVSKAIADQIIEAWKRIGINNVNIILDVDAEIFRLGYGEIEALTLLQGKASEMGTLISHQPGVRIGLLIADEEVIVFTPTPLLIEGASTQPDQPNGIRLGSLPENIAKDIGMGPEGIVDQTIGLQKAPSYAIDKVAEELKLNPPMKFNVAKTILVFNSRFEFIEFELKNCFISRKEVPLSSDLFGLAKGEKAYDNLSSSFKLISKNSQLPEKKISDEKKRISDKYLIPIKGYGVIILRNKREAFEKEVTKLRSDIKLFQIDIEKRLVAEINKNRKTLVAALLPAVIRKPPTRWDKFISGGSKKEKEKEIEDLLNAEIEKAFEDAKKVVDKMDVTAIFKGITYDLLHKKEFLEVVAKAIPSMKSLHTEFLGVAGEKPLQTNLFINES